MGCFNAALPRELDAEYLVVWSGWGGEHPWKYVTEPELRAFLLERVDGGHTFPLNLVWAVRDKGWYDILRAMRENGAVAPSLPSWYPPASQVLELVDELHA